MPEFIPAYRYGDALTEVYELRAAIAYEAAIVSATLEYATFPKGRRPVHGEQVERMRCAARGDRKAYADPEIARHRKWALENAAADQCLTNSQWERAQGYDEPTPEFRAATALLEAQGFAADGFPACASHIQDRLDVVQAEVDRLRGKATT